MISLAVRPTLSWLDVALIGMVVFLAVDLIEHRLRSAQRPPGSPLRSSTPTVEVIDPGDYYGPVTVTTGVALFDQDNPDPEPLTAA